MLRKICLTIAFTAISTHANTVYKCQDGNQVIFSQMPCETDNSENKQLNYPNIQNLTSSESTPPTKSTQNNTNSSIYILSKKKERSLAKINKLKQKYNKDIEIIKTEGLTVGVNRAGSSYLKLLSTKLTELKKHYQNKIQKEYKTLDKIEQEISKIAP